MLAGFGFVVLGIIGLLGNLVLMTWDYATTFTIMAFMGLLLMKVASNYYVHLFRENHDADIIGKDMHQEYEDSCIEDDAND